MNRISRQLVVFLIKPEFRSWRECLKENISHYDNYDLAQELNLTGAIIIGEVKVKQPTWLSFLQEGSNQEIKAISNTSTRALLFINLEDKMFAITFGYGQHMLRDDCYERGFGFKVTINSVDPLKLRSIDIANIEELTVQTRKQTSKSSSMDAFGLNILSDLMCAVTGEPSDKTLGVKITGKDALVLNSKMRFRDLEEKLRKLLTAYCSEKYKENFPWIDNLSEVRDPVILKQLNVSLIETIKTKNFENIHLAPPEIVEWGSLEGFKYSTYKRNDDIFPDLQIEDFINSVQLEKLDLTKLKKTKVLVKIATEENLIPMWKLYDCIVFETYINQELYVLTMGKWFNIQTDFAKMVTDFIKNDIPDFEITLPNCQANESETEYNKRVAESIDNIILMDRELIPCDSARDKIELCDLFTGEGQFIHVKPKKSSSTLSHLFAQARISAESFLQDRKFREKVRQHNNIKKMKMERFFPDAKPTPRDYEIVFAFIDKSSKQLHESLPFFTKLNFMQTTRTLILLGFKVSKTKIKKTHLGFTEKVPNHCKI